MLMFGTQATWSAYQLSSFTPAERAAANATLAPESRFDLAYNAAHALALAALRHRGFRSDNRYLVFQALAHTLRVPTPIWRVLATCHERRNRVEYEGALEVDERLLADLIDAAQAVLAGVRALPPLEHR